MQRPTFVRWITLRTEPRRESYRVCRRANDIGYRLRRNTESVRLTEYVGSFRSAWETLLLVSHGIEPAARPRGKRRLEREPLRKINLHWHDLRHEALSRLADEGVPVHELQMLAGHANITTTQRYMNARANSLAESMRQARQRRADRIAQQSDDNVQVG
jgi:integrase